MYTTLFDFKVKEMDTEELYEILLFMKERLNEETLALAQKDVEQIETELKNRES